MKINEIYITGLDVSPAPNERPSSGIFEKTGSYQVGPVTRADTKGYQVKLEDDHIFELVFEDGTTWFANAETLQDIFPEAAKTDRAGEAIFTLPGEIISAPAERGQVKKAVLKIFNLLIKKDKKQQIEQLAADFEEKQLEGKTGLFRLNTDFQLLDYKPEASNEPFCVLIHGTASSISGSFDKAMETPVMDFLVKNYGERLLAFQHRTLTLNPLENARDLVKALPDKAALHIITTSRGGLVGEVLSRFCQEGPEQGFSGPELDILQKNYPERYYNSLVLTMNDIRSELSKKKITVEKFIRIACPAGGTTLASKRLDHLLNVSMNLLQLGGGIAGGKVLGAFKDLVGAAVDTKNDVYALPGLEAQNPASPFILAINGFTGSNDPSGMFRINNSLAVIAGNSRAEFKFSALWVIASKLFFQQKNDLVVNTVSMSLGTRRTGKVLEYRYEDADIDHFSYFKNEHTSQAILNALSEKWGGSLPEFSTIDQYFSHNRDFDLSKHAGADTPLGRALGVTRTESEKTKPLQVSISMGDLFYAQYPVMAGHFEEDGILYAEKTINYYLDGALKQSHLVGNYPGKIGEHEIFLTGQQDFKGAVIVGLGTPGELTPNMLSKTVEKAAISYLFKARNAKISTPALDQPDAPLGISSLVIGCGYAGLSVETSIKAILQGIYNANINCRLLDSQGDLPAIERVEFVELYEDKAVTSLFAISKIEEDEASPFKITRKGKTVKALLGYRTRIPSDATSEWWNRITVGKGKDKEKKVDCLEFKSATNGAREEVQSLYTSMNLLEGMIKSVSTDNQWDLCRAKTIFELLIPNDFKAQLRRHGNIIWVLDSYTAEYPWELLHDGDQGAKPVCVSGGMIRQLSTPNYKKSIKTIKDKHALVVADPVLNGYISQLPGARKEGEVVRNVLLEQGMDVKDAIHTDHTEILKKMFCHDYKIIHLAGHGVFNEDETKESGMVIGKNMFLTTREIQQMSTVPELVFVNCCHLGKSDGETEDLYQQRYKLAANLGTQLINNGVRCVIAAGWAVNDQAALEFAKVFYEKLFDGYTFGEAVKCARVAVYDHHRGSNTWGAYQCYGDPFYRIGESEEAREFKPEYIIEQQVEVDLVNMFRELETAEGSTEKYLQKLKKIADAAEDAKLDSPLIIETQAKIYMELQQYQEAGDRFRRLLEREDASFSFSAAEKYCNARAKQIIAEHKKDSSSEKILEYQSRMQAVIKEMKILIELGHTAERYNILGSTYKRMAFISEKDQKIQNYMLAAEMYRQGYEHNKSWYSLTNWLILENLLIRAEVRYWETEVVDEEHDIRYIIPSEQEALELLRQDKALLSGPTDKMDYWDLIAGINISLCEYILTFKGTGAQKDARAILNDIKKLWTFAGSKGKKYAEIEHLELILDALTMEKRKEFSNLSKNLEQLKTELEAMTKNE